VDPTGAGDSFAGGMMGWLAAARGPVEAGLPLAMVYGSAVASFCCEGFGLAATTRASRPAIEERVNALRLLTRF